MAKYERPVVAMNDDLAEGIFLASGQSDTEAVTTGPSGKLKITGTDINRYSGGYLLTVHLFNDREKESTNPGFKISFSETVQFTDKLSGTIEGSGTSEFKIIPNFRIPAGGTKDYTVTLTKFVTVTGYSVFQA